MQNKILNSFSYLHYNALYLNIQHVNLNKSPVSFSIVRKAVFTQNVFKREKRKKKEIVITIKICLWLKNVFDILFISKRLQIKIIFFIIIKQHSVCYSVNKY